MKKKFIKDLEKTLDLVVLKKAMAQINFLQFPLYKFFEALSSFVSEVEFEILKDEIKITTCDPSRIGLMEIIFDNDSFKFFRKGKIGINVEEFEKKLKCVAKEESTVSLVYTEEELIMNITSTKRKRTIKRTLVPLNLDLNEVPISTLNNISFPFSFGMTKDDFVDLISNSGRYSEILSINATPKRIHFSESSDGGTSKIDYKKNDLVSLDFMEDELLFALEQESKEEIKQILEEKTCEGSYSLTFLGLVKSFSVVLDLHDKILFSLKTDTPLKVEIRFKKLNNSRLTFYLAPRVSEAEFEEDDFDEAEE